MSDIFPGPAGGYDSTPEGIIAGVGGGSAYVADRPAYGPESELHPPGPVVRLTDALGKWPTLALVQGERECQQALALMLKAETSGSAEQRWAAQNAKRAAQWHVVFWAGAKIPCTPLPEYISGAASPEQALYMIQGRDPDAYLFRDTVADSWERAIRTQGHNLIMVRTQQHCQVWFSLVR